MSLMSLTSQLPLHHHKGQNNTFWNVVLALKYILFLCFIFDSFLFFLDLIFFKKKKLDPPHPPCPSHSVSHSTTPKAETMHQMCCFCPKVFFLFIVYSFIYSFFPTRSPTWCTPSSPSHPLHCHITPSQHLLLTPTSPGTHGMCFSFSFFFYFFQPWDMHMHVLGFL